MAEPCGFAVLRGVCPGEVGECLCVSVAGFPGEVGGNFVSCACPGVAERDT